jgi:WD40 repeat protein
VAFGAYADGRPLLASGSSDRTVWRWDPAAGAPVGKPLRSHTGPVLAVAFGAYADGRPLLASGGNDQTVQLWDPATGAPVGTLVRRTSPRAVSMQNTQLAIADEESVTVVEVMGNAG